MDTFSEQILRQKLDFKRMLIILSCVVAAVIVCAVCFVFSPMLFLPAAALCGFGLYWLISMQSWEVEYAVTNGDIDIDRIVARRDRKTIVRVRGEKIEALQPIRTLDRHKHFDRVVMAARSSSTATWYFTYHSKKGSTLVLFEPDDRVLKSLRGGLSRVVQIETDRAMRDM